VRDQSEETSAGLQDPPAGGERFSMGAKKVDIHITVDEKTLKAAKIRCIQDDLVLSEVITDLLQQWVNGRIKAKKG
jgi:hypothetical protein